ncbi:hypothetical protein Aph02nite_42040 [Actinoplanes philippinensis]|uniref:Uncharacterized protein n=1 Tax=Actinoplanes philippinensis TaxID=35752 RepID=A0A1I2H0S0_9ACTN|nr:hypothetical protein Aph02nite_42040 [Actinoplanes philippinensis]SFF22889.1 hypothetical protein SAMN05421541_107333 [Actinoplanes philippinensis]
MTGKLKRPSCDQALAATTARTHTNRIACTHHRRDNALPQSRRVCSPADPEVPKINAHER